MAVVIDATVGGAAANSYVTAAWADAYMLEDLYGGGFAGSPAAAWSAESADARAAALIRATRMLDDGVAWSGAKATTTQALRWPRSGVIDPDGIALDPTLVPDFLRRAVVDLARYLLTSDIDDAEPRQVRRVRAGDLDVEFTADSRRSILPPGVIAAIRPYGSLSGATAKLIRV